MYEQWTGQVINRGKLALFFSNKISSSCKQGILPLKSFVEGNFPTTYLGAPQSPRHITSQMLEGLVQKNLEESS